MTVPQPAPTPSPITPSAPTTNAEAIGKFVTTTLTDDGSLTTAGTPQNLAYNQLLATSPDLNPSNPVDQVEITQRYTLNTIYYSGSGVDWTSQDGWTSATDICDRQGLENWFGITCDNLQVTGIELQENKFAGTIPSEIRGLSSLQTYDLNRNAVFGVIPTTIGEATSLGKYCLEVQS